MVLRVYWGLFGFIGFSGFSGFNDDLNHGWWRLPLKLSLVALSLGGPALGV